MERKIVLIGSGNLAEQLALALTEQQAGLIQIYGRNQDRCAAISKLCNGIAHTSLPEELQEADLYIVAVSDRAVDKVTNPLPIPEKALVAHTAGSIPISHLNHKRHGSFYPFQTFTKGRRVDFREIPIFLECSDSDGLKLLHEVAEKISDRVFEANCEERRRIHLAGVFACNFVNSLYGIGEELMHEAGVGFEELKPLIRETARKALASSRPQTVQTGPAVRGDRAVQQSHLALLDEIFKEQSESCNRLKNMYNEISDQIWEISKRTF